MHSHGLLPRRLVRGDGVRGSLSRIAQLEMNRLLKRTPPPCGGGVIGHGRRQRVAIPWPFRHSRRVVIRGVPASTDKLQKVSVTLPPDLKNLCLASSEA